MSDNKKNVLSLTPDVEREKSHFLRLKQKEALRSRLKALEAMILLEQRTRGVTLEVKTENQVPKPKLNISSQYTEEGKLKFSDAESKKVQHLRDHKAKRIEFFLKKQNSNEGRPNLSTNQGFPFILKSDLGKPHLSISKRY